MKGSDADRPSTAPVAAAARPWRADLPLYAAWAAGALLAAALFLVLALRVDPARKVIHGVDGVGYTLWVRSLVGDGDLDFADEIDRVHPGEAPDVDQRTPTGHRPNKYGVGVSLLASPFYLAARAVDRLHGAAGVEADEGWTVVDRAALALASIAWGFAGLVLAHRLALRVASATAAGWAVTLLAAGTNVLYYFVREPFLSHLDSFFALALSAWLTERAWRRGGGRGAWAAAGMAAGLAATVRLTGVLFLAAPLVLLASDAKRDGAWRRDRLAGLALGWLAGMAPQLVAWRVVYGSWWADAYEGEGFTHLFAPRLLAVLVSSRHGLLAWSPLLVLALAGIPELLRRAPVWGRALAVWAALLWWANASWEQWWLGHSFGHRGFVCLFAFFAVALAAFLDGPARRLDRRWLVAAITLAVAWNAALMLAYLAEMVPYSGSFSWWGFVTSLPDLPAAVWRKAHGG